MNDVAQGRVSRHDRFGKFSAVIWAKFGARVARAPVEDRQRMSKAEQFVQQVGRILGEVGAHVDARHIA
eukprot:120515-Pyramimonas_sp.AAC.1